MGNWTGNLLATWYLMIRKTPRLKRPYASPDYQGAAEWMANQKATYVMKEAALLFESGAEKELDQVIGVSAPLAIRLKRVMERDRISGEEVMKRITRQMDEDEKNEALQLYHHQ